MTIAQPHFAVTCLRRTAPLLLALGFLQGIASAAETRALPEGHGPSDVRLQPLKDLDGYFPFQVPTNKEQWDRRAEQVRRQTLVALGLWPMPEKTALHPVIHGRIDHGDHTVEKVYFESAPGFFVTGSLYRPKGKSGRLPAVLSAHGHWPNGRFHDAGLENVRKEIVQGAERFEEGGRSPLQARCVQLARMGLVVFHFDMLGYADSGQIPMAVAHTFAKQRPEMNQSDGWGLFSPVAEGHLQSVMGLQTWNSIRALDFLLSLPDVDSERVAVTGASGGATQTFILGAIDSRPRVTFPAVMVSTAMQGGCTCENTSLLRVGTGNIELAGLTAPRPQGLTSADDWTREIATKGFPELKQLYGLMGAPDNILLKRGEHFGHNFNYVSRAAMYSWLNRHLQLGLKEPIVEEDYTRLSAEELSVWGADHPAPEGGPDFERQILQHFHRDAQAQVAAHWKSSETIDREIRPALDIVLRRTLKETGKSEFHLTRKVERNNYLEMTGLLRNLTHSEETPVTFLHPQDWNGRTVIWLDETGKEGLFGAGAVPTAEVKRLLDAGVTVIGIDLLFQGEFLQEGTAVTKTRRVKNPREAAGYTFGYNDALFAQRTHDVLTLIQFVRTHETRTKRLELIALGAVGPIGAAARAQAGMALDGAAIDTQGFRFQNVRDLHDVNFLPGGAKYGDLPGLLALAAPGPLWLTGEGGEAPDLLDQRYRSSKALDRLTLFSGASAEKERAAVGWILRARQP